MLATLTIHLHIPACTSLKEKRGRDLGRGIITI